jgi:hypothetical protein
MTGKSLSKVSFWQKIRLEYGSDDVLVYGKTQPMLTVRGFKKHRTPGRILDIILSVTLCLFGAIIAIIALGRPWSTLGRLISASPALFLVAIQIHHTMWMIKNYKK